MTAPEGYTRLPDGVRCRCLKMWSEADGSFWCCRTSAAISIIASTSQSERGPTVKFRRLPHGEGLPLPSYATDGAAGLDLRAAGPGKVYGNSDDPWLVVPTGFAVEIPPGYEGQVRGRSGLAFNDQIIVHVGTIDSDYRGEIKVALFFLNRRPPYILRVGQRIAQLVIAPVSRARIDEVTDLSETVRGEKGFGSTGV